MTDWRLFFIESLGMSHHAPQSHSPSSPSKSSPHPCSILPKNPPKSMKSKTMHTQKPHLAPPSFQHLLVHPSSTGCGSVSHSTPFCPVSSTHKMFITMSFWSGSRPLTSATPSILDPHGDLHSSLLPSDVLRLWFCQFSCIHTTGAKPLISTPSCQLCCVTRATSPVLMPSPGPMFVD